VVEAVSSVTDAKPLPSKHVPKLVATDLDGTLLTSAGEVSPRTRRALAHLQALGIPLVVVTGRPVRWMDELWGAIGGNGAAVLSNGAVVYDVAAREIRTAWTLEPLILAEVAARLRERIPGTAFALEKAGGIGIEPGFRSRLDNASQADTTPVSTGRLEELLDDRTVKMLAQHEEIAPEDFWAEVEGAVGDLVTTTWSSAHAMVEISARGVTKAATLAGLVDELGLRAADVLAFGDMPNDIGMLEWAGTSYAMANAHPLARQAAGHAALTNDQDGVAEVLELIFAMSRP
jgi:Cof subfamily protein (haloacid dehalogenase superfamily)